MIEVKPQKNGYNSRKFLSLKGTGDLGAGENLKLSMGETIVCGRSRHCDWSLRRAPSYLKSDANGRDVIRHDLRYNSVSRKHARISYVAQDMVEIENLSGNGTLVDGKLVDKMMLTDCRTKTHRVQLGPKGVILEIQPGSLPL